MDKDYIQRLEGMLDATNAKIAALDEIDDLQEREVKRAMFLSSKKEIEDLLKQAKSSKPAAKKETSKKAVNKKPTTKKAPVKKPAKPAAKKPAVKKAPVKKATKPLAVKPAVKNVDAVVIGDENKSFKQQEKEISKVNTKEAKATKEEAKETFKSKEFKETKVDEKKQAKADKLAAKEAKKAAKEKAKQEKIAKQQAEKAKVEKAKQDAIKKAEADKKAKIEADKLAAKEAKKKAVEDKKAAKEKAKQEKIAKQQAEKAKAEKAKQDAIKKAEADKKANALKLNKEQEAKKKQQEKELAELEAKNKKQQEELEKIAAKKKADKEEAKRQKRIAKEKAKQEKIAAKLAKQHEMEARQRELEMNRKLEDKKLREAKANAEKIAKEQQAQEEARKAKEAKVNKLANEASEKAAQQAKADAKKKELANEKAEKENIELAKENKQEKAEAVKEDKRTAEQRERAAKRADIQKGEFIKVDLPPIPDEGVKSLKQISKRQKQLTSKYSKQILEGAIVTTTDYKPETSKHVIELHDVTKSYITGDVETPVLKGIDIKLDKGDFIVILGPSGSGKTTFLNTISGLDKATKGDVFVLGYNLSYLKDSHLTKFRRKHVGFIFQQYNLLTNLTAKENAEVGENLSAYKNPDMTIEDIFETIGMKTQMNKYPHQMSGGQQQRVSIARALAKNPDILFADEPTGALDEEMGRKVLEILVEVNKRYGTTVIVVTHNPNIAKIGNTVIHIKNGLVDQIEKNAHPEDPSTIEWS